MGLDITYSNKITYADPQPNEDDRYDGDYIHILHDPIQCPNLKEGYYTYDQRGSFRAGSYSGYNQWRNRLAQLALNMTDQEVWNKNGQVEAFGELIHFSDCEGTIGPEICAKLAKDFQNYSAKIKAQLNIKENDTGFDDDTYFWEKYQEWQKAFETAANTGAVWFH